MNSVNVLIDHDIKPSLIRVMIYDFLKGTKTHPTVDEIYQHIHPEAPTLSRTTVYNSVKLFSEKGLLKVLPIEGLQIRYDADTKFHGHFLCDDCKKVFDFEIDTASESGLDGFDVTQREVFYTGCCKTCLSK